MPTHPPKLVVIGGPTATGKTGLAVELAQKFDAELVGADSMQVYRGMNIGTAKPTPEELEGVPHWMLDVVSPSEPFDAARFVEEADKVIGGIVSRGKRVIVVGGTGLYIRTLLKGMHEGPAADEQFREPILARAKREGWPPLHRELSVVDPEAGERLHPNDGVRILRALEVYHLSGKTMSDWQREHRFADCRYPSLYFALSRERSDLRGRISLRVDQMMEAGFLAEVESLMASGFGPDLKPMQGLGYKRLLQHIAGECSLSEATQQTKTDTHRFAKRQVTWFKGEEGAKWVEPTSKAVETQICEFWGD